MTRTTTSNQCFSPRTEQRILAKQQRMDMGINEAIADKLHDRNAAQPALPSATKSKHPSNGSPNQAVEGPTPTDHHLHKRIEQILGPHCQATQSNLHKLAGVCHQPTTPVPLRKANDHKDKRKMHDKHKSTPDPIIDILKTKEKQRSSESVKANDLRHKLNQRKRKSCPEISMKERQQITHKDLKDKMKQQMKSDEIKKRSKIVESLIEFTPLPSKKKIESDVESDIDNKIEKIERIEKVEKIERIEKKLENQVKLEVKQEKRSEHHDHRSEERRSSSERRKCKDIRRKDERRDSEEKKRIENRRHAEEASKRKRLAKTERLLSKSDSEIDSDCSSAGSSRTQQTTPHDITKLSMIFELMTSGIALSPVHNTFDNRKGVSTFGTAVQQARTLEDEEEDEFDISKLSQKLKQEGLVNVLSPKHSPPPSTSKHTTSPPPPPTSPQEHVPSPLVSYKDEDSEDEEFPLSKSHMSLLQAEEDSEPDDMSSPLIKGEDSSHSRDLSVIKHVHKTHDSGKQAELAMREVKPMIAVNPTIKNTEYPSTSESGESPPCITLEQVIKLIHDGQYNECSVDFRELLPQTRNMSMYLSFGYQKLSSKFIKDSNLLKALCSAKRKQREESDCSDLSSDEQTSAPPREKPSCIVPGVPRTDASKLAKPEPFNPPHQSPVRDVSPMTRSPRRHSPRRGSISPRPNSPHGHDVNYHRDNPHSREWNIMRKRRRVTHDAEYDQYPPPPHYPHHFGVPVTPYAYLHIQPPLPQHELLMRSHLIPPTKLSRPTFLSEAEDTKEKTEVEMSLKKQLLPSDEYITKARSLKREADPMENQVEKIKKYLEAVIQYVYSSLSMCARSEHIQAYQLFHSTLGLLDHVLSPRARRGLDVRLQNKRLAALCLMMVSAIQRHMWVMKRHDCRTLQEKCHNFVRQLKRKDDTRSATPARTVNLNNSSPTPSPAGSVASIASYTGTELLDSGSTSPIKSTELISHDMLRHTNNYFKLATHLYEWTENWEEAGKHALKEATYFTHLDEQCGGLRPTSHLYNVACYIGQGLLELNHQ